MNDFQNQSKRIQDICFMLYEREVEARKKENDEFKKLSNSDQLVEIAEKKFKQKIIKEENTRILQSKHYKNNMLK